ncbi:apolipoprotein N-acyltransferase [Thalassotalea sp. PLHSN55]|uniref:apolipoprotein N-acyltransferase n=1 Tax=Thalassotalea sp. PLHSN55 TaxID=3435888 RepID=UPI003F83EC92
MLKSLSQSLLKISRSKHHWLSFLSGLSLVLAYAPYSQWWLPFLVLPVWFNLLIKQTPKHAFQHGLLFAFGWFAAGISWVHVAIDQFGGLPLIISLILMLLLCLYLALYPALACYLSAKFSTQKTVNLWLLPILWLITEFLRANILTGFPWLSLGYSQIDGPFASLAPIIGEIGITFVVLLVSLCLVHIYQNKQRIISAVVILSTIVSSYYSSTLSWLEVTNEQIKVALIQGNIEQSLKWQPEQEWPTMLKYLELSKANYDADIIVWPESAIPVLEPAAQDYLDLINSSAALNNSAIITGVQNYYRDSREYFNGLIVAGIKDNTSDEGSYYYNNPNRYYKNHLLPIGEFVPFQDLLRPIAPLFNLPMSSFSRGNYVQPNLVAKGKNILPLICFEIAFPEQLAANLTDNTDILLTVSNDAWFGDSHGPHQHLEIARMRALEFGRPLLRATNNGVTAVIDHNGKITKVVPQFEEAVLRAEVTIVTGQTPYSRLKRLIN